jgi:hypothetical protein
LRMPNRLVHTQRSGYGAGTGIASTRHGRTMRRPITIRTMGTPTATTAGMAAEYILAAGDITAVDMSAVEFVPVAEDTLAVAEDAPVAATVVIGRGELNARTRGRS